MYSTYSSRDSALEWERPERLNRKTRDELGSLREEQR